MWIRSFIPCSLVRCLLVRLSVRLFVRLFTHEKRKRGQTNARGQNEAFEFWFELRSHEAPHSLNQIRMLNLLAHVINMSCFSIALVSMIHTASPVMYPHNILGIPENFRTPNFSVTSKHCLDDIQTSFCKSIFCRDVQKMFWACRCDKYKRL